MPFHFYSFVSQNVVNEVETAWLSMLQQLLSTLRTDLPLPSVLQIVGYLRRMELFSEVELRLKFLQCRDSWLQAMLGAIPKEDGKSLFVPLFLGVNIYRLVC